MMRAYEQSHPWIRFDHSFERAAPELWMLLGEAISKCEHIAGVALTPAIAQELHSVYLAKGVHATTAIEGNTLSEAEVRAQIEGRQKLPPSKQYLGHEVNNILHACNEVILKGLVNDEDGRLTPERIKLFNRLVLADLEVDEGVVPGELRPYSVGVASYRAAPAEDCEYLLERLCDWLNAPQGNLSPLQGASRAIILAILAHLYIAWIHPFGDGNGRTARLVEFQLLVSAGVPVPAAHLLSDHYNETRSKYYRELDYASRSNGNVIPFVMYAARGFVDGLRTQIDRVRTHQIDVAWENYIHEICGKKNKHKSVSEKRQIHLALDLSAANAPVPYEAIMTLTPRIALAYAGKTRRTLTRDLNALKKFGLISKTKAGFRARKERMQAFLPLRKGPLLQSTTFPTIEDDTLVGSNAFPIRDDDGTETAFLGS